MKKMWLTLLTAVFLAGCGQPVHASQTVQGAQPTVQQLEQQLIEAKAKELAAKTPAPAQQLQAAVTSAVQDGATEKWINFGEQVGKMLGSVAKEVGVQVNVFAQTPVGKMTMALIVWNYIGSVAYHFVGSLIVLMVGVSFIVYFARRSRSLTIEYDTEKRDIFGRSVKKSYRHAPMDSERMGWLMVSVAATVAATVWVMFTG